MGTGRDREPQLVPSTERGRGHGPGKCFPSAHGWIPRGPPRPPTPEPRDWSLPPNARVPSPGCPGFILVSPAPQPRVIRGSSWPPSFRLSAVLDSSSLRWRLSIPPEEGAEPERPGLGNRRGGVGGRRGSRDTLGGRADGGGWKTEEGCAGSQKKSPFVIPRTTQSSPPHCLSIPIWQRGRCTEWSPRSLPGGVGGPGVGAGPAHLPGRRRRW